jgi:hypothetical protein
MQDTPTPDEYDELRKILFDSMRGPKRYGWKRSLLSQQTVEYIIQREHVLEAILLIQKVDWQNINSDNKELSKQIKENVLHSLAVMAQAMRRIEIDHI